MLGFYLCTFKVLQGSAAARDEHAYQYCCYYKLIYVRFHKKLILTGTWRTLAQATHDVPLLFVYLNDFTLRTENEV